MSILSDVTIRRLCTAPSRVWDEAVYEKAMEEQNRKGWPMAGAAVEALTAQLSEQCWRNATLDEIQAFQSMIRPFHPYQVKTAQTNISISLNEDLAQWVERNPGQAVPREEIAAIKSRYTAVERKIISSGTTSYGYDVSLAHEFKLFTNMNSAIIDPKRPDPGCMVDAKVIHDPETGEDYVILPPNSYLLGRTVETFCIPRDVLVLCVGKSTYARSGIHVNVTPIEPGFEGTVVLEFSNGTPLPAKIYVNEGAAQFLFLRGDRPCEVSYADRAGKYMHQSGVTLSKV